MPLKSGHAYAYHLHLMTVLSRQDVCECDRQSYSPLLAKTFAYFYIVAEGNNKKNYNE